MPKETPKENIYSSLGKNSKTGSFSTEEKSRRNTVNGKKSLPSPRKLNVEPNGATDQHIPKKTGITSTNGTQKTEILEEKQGILIGKDMDYYYKTQNCIPLPQEHPDAYGEKTFKGIWRKPCKKI